jgi:uncharacterized protein (DUF427 family)
MMRAIWNGATIAESDRTVQVEGNHYFPFGDVAEGYLHESETHTVCSWKGTASYFDVVVDGRTNPDAAWYYPEPMVGAERVAGRVAFWRGVQIEATAGTAA